MEAVVRVFGYAGGSVTIAGEGAGTDGVWLLSEVEGFYDPEVEAVTKPLASRPGTRFLSHRVVERTVVFKVLIEDGEREGWRTRDARWRRLWSWDEYSTIAVTVGGRTRRLKARLSEIEVDTTYDPHTNSATEVVMTVVADDPFWYGASFEKEVRVAGETTFTVPYANPTENRVYPVFVLEGGASWTLPAFHSPRGAKEYRLPALEEDEDVRVSTDPGARQLVSVNDTPVWARMNGVRFDGYIPPFTGSLSVTLSHDSPMIKTARIVLERPFDRPWGEV